MMQQRGRPLIFLLLIVSFVAVRPFQRAPHSSLITKNFFVRLPKSVYVDSSWSTSLNAILGQVYTRDSSRSDFEEDGLVLDDFDQIIEAVNIFKKFNGDFDIPLKFDVPAEDPWPSNLHGLRLGRRLDKLLSSDDFFKNHSDKVNTLGKTGFNPSQETLVDDWKMIREAMKTYKKIYGDLRVPSKFEVPDEEPWPRFCRTLKLGVRIAAIRSAGRYVKDRPERKHELDELGFEWRLRDNTYRQQVVDDLFEQVYDALVCYKKNVEDSLNVSADFVVPSEGPWPEATWGLNLGSQVQAIRDKDKLVFGHEDREKRLNELGFQWEESGRAQFSRKRFDIVFTALAAYKEKYGDLMVPQAFMIPIDDASWPEETRGLKLGARVNAIRCQGTLVSNSPERREKLNQLGFTWELPSHARKRRKSEDAATAGSGEGDDKSGSSESSSSSPKSGKGKVGGSSETTTIALPVKWPAAQEDSADSIDAAKKSGLSSMGVPDRAIGEYRPVMNYDPTRMFEPANYREVAAEAVREYMQDREYSQDPDIRQRAHFDGHLTPQAYHSIISRSVPDDDVAAMKKIGYRILEFGKFNWDIVMQALQVYKDIHGNLDVPYDFVVNEEVIVSGVGFDEKWEGLLLGEIVEGVRIGDIDGLEDATRRKALDALEFRWGDKKKYQRYRFVPMILGLKLFKHLYGFPLPQSDFVVPDAPQWPYWMANMPLGEWAAVARVQQKTIEEFYPHRRDMLNALEFMWWIPPGTIPSKYFRPVK